MRLRFFFTVIAALAIGSILFHSAAALAQQPLPPWRFELPWKTETSVMTVGDEELTVEIADTSLLRTRGLSYRDGLEPGTGMLFVFGEARPLTFWMYEMRFCLDIIWIDNGQILGAAESVCPESGVPSSELTTYSSPCPASYVLEVPAGWMKEHGFGVGTPVQIDPSLRDRDESP
jgi:uncharacterized membrane protein (UPF0127 family)